MKLSFGIIVLNGEPFIKYNLESLYPHAHEIILVEGAVEKFSHAATSDGHSLDNTVEIIQNFPDPERKIRLIQRHGFWQEKDEMANAYMEACTGDYIWQVDVDEFYKPEDIESVRELLAKCPEITQVNFRTIGFWRSFRTRIMGASFVFGADEFIRVFRFRPGYRYVTHRPPTLADEMQTPYEHKRVVTAAEMEKLGIVQYHYSYVIPEIVKSKSHYYSQMGWGLGCDDGLNWVKRSWLKLNDPLRIHLIDFPPSWIEPFNGVHPPAVLRMIKDIQYREDDEIDYYLKSEWKTYAVAGQRIADICRRAKLGDISGLRAALLIMREGFLPISVKRFNADKAILKTAYRIYVGNYN